MGVSDRGLSDLIKAEVDKQQITLVHLFYFGFAAPDYLADGRMNIDWNGNTYYATGDILEVPEIKDTVSPGLDQITITVSGVNQANIASALGADYTNVPVSIYRVLLDSAMRIVDAPVEISSGVITAPDIAEDPYEGTCTLTWKVTSHWAGFERVAGRRCNDADQQKWFPGDRGLEYASKSVAKLKWGTAA